MSACDLQRRLNVVRKNRTPSPLGSIPESGVADKTTRYALRAFQHEHNMFMHQRLLLEHGQLDPLTNEALDWWMDVLQEARSKV